MAPEQARGTSKRSGPAADIYSLGAILYELLVGHPPFRGETILDTLVKAVSQKPVSPRRLEAEIPTDLERICLKCLQKDPAQRYASAEALAEALRRFLAGGPVPDVPPSRAAPEQGPVRAGGLRKRLLWGAGVAVLLLAGLIVLFLGASRPGAPSAQDRQQLPVAQPPPPAAGEQARLLTQSGPQSPPPQNGKEPHRENGKEPSQQGKETPPPQAAGKSSGTDPAGRTSGPPFLPDIQFSLPGMPAVGRLAVQASPKAHARYAEGSRAVVLVLDCSGSMMGKLPGGQTRFDEATRALLVVLAGIPKDTQVSVWAFSHRFDIDTGRSMQNHDAEQTIQRVHLARNWDPTPANLALVKRRIAMLVPYNETPIVRSLMEARKDFTDQHSFKTLVVLTDGMDNRFEAQPGGRWNGDPVYNPGGKLTIPAFLAQAFARDNIAVRVVGFQLPANEQAEAIRQFRTPLENLPNKGKFYLIDDPKRLIENLRESLTQRLSFTLEEMDGWPVKGLKGGVSISRVGQDSHWITLSPGYYWVVIDATKRLRQKIEVRRGDRLLLTLDEKDDGFVLQRGLVQNDFRDKPLREARSGAWLLKVLQNQHSLQEDALQLMVTAEAVRDREVGGVRTLGRVTPSLILFQVRPQGDSKSRPVSLRYRSLTDWTAPAWGLVIKPWDRRAQPIPEAFWSEDPPTIVGTLRRGSHFSGDLQVLPKGGAVEVQLHKGERGPVQLLSLTIEKHLVETHDGKRQEVSCLVVRLTFPPGKPVMAQLPDFSGGQEHRFDSEAGRYTGSFWEMTPQQGQQEVKTLHLISLTGFREAALSSGQYARIELAVPDNHPRPQPP